MPAERKQLARLSTSLAACPSEVKGYGACIATNSSNIERGVCEREYQLLYKCLRQAVRARSMRRAGAKALRAHLKLHTLRAQTRWASPPTGPPPNGTSRVQWRQSRARR
jgi:hypothetical protein